MIQPQAPLPAGGFSKFISVADKLIFKISNSGRTIPTLTTSPPFPWFLSRKSKQRRANLGLFQIHLRVLPPAANFSIFIFVAENCRPSSLSNLSYWRPLQKLLTIAFRWNFVGGFLFHTSLTSSSNWTIKTASRNNMSIKFYIRQWTVDTHTQYP